MSTDTKISFLDQLKAAIKQFERVQHEYRSFGASDTEPNAIFASIMRNAVRGVEVKVPKTGDGWELYASSMNCGTAATALHQLAQDAVDIIEACPLGESREMREYIKDRYDW